MSISFACSCGKRLKVSDTLAGKKVKCPDCQKVSVVPAEGAAPAKSAAQATRPPVGKPAPPPAKSKPSVPAAKAPAAMSEDPDISSLMDDEAPPPRKKAKPPVEDVPGLDDFMDEEPPPPKKKGKPAQDPDMADMFSDEDEAPAPKKKGKPAPVEDDAELSDLFNEEEAPKPKKKGKPSIDDEDNPEPDMSFLEEADASFAKAPKKKPGKFDDDEPPPDDDEDFPPAKSKKSKKPAMDEDEDDPFKDEDEDDLPKKGKKKAEPAKKSGKMMKIVIILGVLLLVGGGTAMVFIDNIMRLISGPEPEKKKIDPSKLPPAPKVTPFTVDDGGFTVKTLAEPKLEKKFDAITIGDDKFEFKVYKSGFFRIAYGDVGMAADEEAQQSILDAYANELAKRAKGKLDKNEKITGPGKEEYRGRDIKIADKKLALHARLFLVKDRLYEVSATGPPASVDSDEAKAFLDSFALSAPSKNGEHKGVKDKEPKSKEVAFKTYKSAEGRFTVKGPGEPKVEDKTVTFGETNTYSVEYKDDDDDPDAAVMKMIEDAKAKSTKAPALDKKYFGNELDYKMDDDHVKARIYIVKKRIYTIKLVGTADFVKKDSKKFFDSFSLLPEGKEKTKPKEKVKEKEPVKEEAFEEFRSKEGGFKIMAPGEPESVKDGKAFIFSKKYYIEYSDEDAKKTFDSFLEKAKENKIKTAKLPLLGKKYSGNQYEYPGDNDQLVRAQYYLVDKRLYTLVVQGDARFIKSDSVKKFFDSFSVFAPEAAEAPKKAVPALYVSKEGKFKVTAPGKPEVDEGDNRYIFGKGDLYVIQFNDVADDKEIKTTVDFLLKKGKAAKLPALEKKYQAHEVVFGDGDEHTRMRVIVVKKRIYTVAVSGSEAFVKSNEAKMFFDSFQPVTGSNDASFLDVGPADIRLAFADVQRNRP